MKDHLNHPPIEEQLRALPASPGVYIMKGPSGGVLYVGKARSLRSRVRSYFHGPGDGRYAVRFLASRTAIIDYIVTDNEKEALFLEDTLLKKFKPRYNIRLKDSKTYVSIKITTGERFPRILVTRQVKKDGSKYFGPYVSARAVREMIKTIRRVFPLCVRASARLPRTARPCLDYQLGLCSGPSAGLISEEDYGRIVHGAVLFLSGRDRELIRGLEAEMARASDNLDFERAASIRDRIRAIESMLEGQKVVCHGGGDRDVFGLSRGDETMVVQALLVRGGRLVSSLDYAFPERGLPTGEIWSSFLTQFYRAGRYVPGEVLVQARPVDAPLLEDWLSGRAGRRVHIRVPVRGEKKRLVEMAVENAGGALLRRGARENKGRAAMEELKRRLHLRTLPRWIEAFDISNISGTLAVGAMVSFRDGVPERAGYRLFRIKGVTGQDDYAMMEEVLRRRYARAAYAPMEQGKGNEGEGEAHPALPDLVLLDGGKGQLGVAMRVMAGLGLAGEVPLAALAKERAVEAGGRGRRAVAGKSDKGSGPGGGKTKKGERVYLPGARDPVMLRPGAPSDMLLCQIRDEVHRTAITYQRKLRKKKLFTSPLDGIAGIGERRKKTLLKRFRSLSKLIEAPIGEITRVPGITEDMAREIKGLTEET